MPIILYLIIIIVFVAKAISKSSSQGNHRSSAQGNKYARDRFTQSQRSSGSAGSAQARKSQPRQSQSRMAHRTADNPTAAYSYKRSGFSYSSLKPNEDGLEVLMRRNRERERELEKRIQ